MNTRLPLSSAFAAAALLALAPAQAQAPGAGNSSQTRQNLQAAQRLEIRIATMQAQINQLQAQVKQLQAQLRAASPTPAISPFDRVPNLTLPNLTLPNSSGQGGLGSPNIHGLPVVPPSSRYNSIPNYTATFIAQPAH